MTSPSPSRLARRTVDVLKAVAARPEGIGLSALARDVEVPKATCRRVLTVLEQEGWVALEPATHRYRVGLGLLSVAGGLLGPGGASAQVRAAVEELARTAHETAGFDVLALPDVTVLVQVAGPQLIGQSLRPTPVRQPAWRTSTGKAMLAACDDAGLDLLLTGYRDADGWLDGTEPAAFRAALTRTRELGWATTVDELEPGASSVAAAVPLPGRATYALWVGGPTFRLPGERLAELGALVAAAAQRLATTLTLAGAPPPGGHGDHGAPRPPGAPLPSTHAR